MVLVMDVSLEHLAVALHSAIDAFVAALSESADPSVRTVRTAAGDAAATTLLGAAATGLSARVVASLAELPVGDHSVGDLADRLGTTATGVLSALGTVAKRAGGYRNLPLIWGGSGITQSVGVDAPTRAALREALDLDGEVEQ